MAWSKRSIIVRLNRCIAILGWFFSNWSSSDLAFIHSCCFEYFLVIIVLIFLTKSCNMFRINDSASCSLYTLVLRTLHHVIPLLIFISWCWYFFIEFINFLNPLDISIISCNIAISLSFDLWPFQPLFFEFNYIFKF